MSGKRARASLASYIEDLRHSVDVAALNFDIWWTYKQRRERARFVNVLNQYPLFFRASIHAHFVAVVVALYRIYETRRDTFNIAALVRRLEQENHIPRKTLASIRGRVTGAKSEWVKVAILRNKAFAHRDLGYAITDVFREAQIKPNDLRRLVRRTRNLLNRISFAIDRSSHAFNVRASADTRRMLADLKTYNLKHACKQRR